MPLNICQSLSFRQRASLKWSTVRCQEEQTEDRQWEWATGIVLKYEKIKLHELHSVVLIPI